MRIARQSGLGGFFTRALAERFMSYIKLHGLRDMSCEKSIVRPAFFIAALWLAGTAHADSLAPARTAYAEGRFLECAELAEAIGTSDGYALASNCVERHGTYVAEKVDRQALYEEAMQFGQEAIRLDAANAWAHLQTAQAVGLYAESLGGLKAGRYVGQVRDGMEKALELDPTLVDAAFSLGAWHAGVVDNAGRMIARMAYGATGKQATTYFDRALELGPQVKEAHYEYAKALLALNPRRNRERARELFNQAIALPPEDAVDRILHEKAVKRLAELD